MKKTLLLLIALVGIFAVTGCEQGSAPAEPSAKEGDTANAGRGNEVGAASMSVGPGDKDSDKRLGSAMGGSNK